MTTIRAYGDVARFTRRLLSLMDYGNRPSMCLFYTNMWLTVRMQIGGALFATLAAIYIVVDKNVNAALAGFVMTCELKCHVCDQCATE